LKDSQDKKLGERIRRLLEESDISQRELARRLNVGPNQVSRWVLGNVSPSYAVLNSILKVCRKPQMGQWLLTGKDSMSHGIKPTPEKEEDAMLKDDLLIAQKKIISLQDEIICLKDLLLKGERGKRKPLVEQKVK